MDVRVDGYRYTGLAGDFWFLYSPLLSLGLVGRLVGLFCEVLESAGLGSGSGSGSRTHAEPPPPKIEVDVERTELPSLRMPPRTSFVAFPVSLDFPPSDPRVPQISDSAYR